MLTIEKQRQYDIKARGLVRASEVNRFDNPKQFKNNKDNPKQPTPEMILGTAFHYFMVNPDTVENNYTILYKSMLPYPESTYAKTENKLYRDKLAEQCDKEGKYLIIADSATVDMINDFNLMRNSILEKKINIIENGRIKEEIWIKDILLEGLSEQSFYPVDTETGLKLSMRPDFFTKTRSGIIIDYKTDRDASNGRNGFGKRALWDNVIKEVIYKDYISKELNTEIYHIFYLVVEKKPPFLSSLFKISEEVEMWARLEYRKRLNVIAECYANDNWPGYEYETPSGFFMIELPNYMKGY